MEVRRIFLVTVVGGGGRSSYRHHHPMHTHSSSDMSSILARGGRSRTRGAEGRDQEEEDFLDGVSGREGMGGWGEQVGGTWGGGDDGEGGRLRTNPSSSSFSSLMRRSSLTHQRRSLSLCSRDPRAPKQAAAEAAGGYDGDDDNVFRRNGMSCRRSLSTGHIETTRSRRLRFSSGDKREYFEREKEVYPRYIQLLRRRHEGAARESYAPVLEYLKQKRMAVQQLLSTGGGGSPGKAGRGEDEEEEDLRMMMTSNNTLGRRTGTVGGGGRRRDLMMGDGRGPTRLMSPSTKGGGVGRRSLFDFSPTMTYQKTRYDRPSSSALNGGPYFASSPTSQPHSLTAGLAALRQKTLLYPRQTVTKSHLAGAFVSPSPYAADGDPGSLHDLQRGPRSLSIQSIYYTPPGGAGLRDKGTTVEGEGGQRSMMMVMRHEGESLPRDALGGQGGVRDSLATLREGERESRGSGAMDSAGSLTSTAVRETSAPTGAGGAGAGRDSVRSFPYFSVAKGMFGRARKKTTGLSVEGGGCIARRRCCDAVKPTRPSSV